ncbi:unnamed protein product [Moneuplotes crassus]|uniref:Uncharacterized protein n=1 Tax=Euplotes crassus TaxID=5936 RepID=A0AAD1UCG4_EUPCR|nr:unnamed protein product [Moneuplotes crassus]
MGVMLQNISAEMVGEEEFMGMREMVAYTGSSCVKCFQNSGTTFCKQIGSDINGICTTIDHSGFPDYDCSNEYKGDFASKAYLTCNYDQEICGYQTLQLKSNSKIRLEKSPQNTICRYKMDMLENNSPSELKFTVENLESTRLDVIEQASRFGFNLLQSIDLRGSAVINVARSKKIIVIVVPKENGHGLVQFTVTKNDLGSSFLTTKIILITVGSSVLYCCICAYIVCRISKVELDDKQTNKVVPENCKRNPISSILDGSNEFVNYDPLSLPDILGRENQQRKFLNNRAIISKTNRCKVPGSTRPIPISTGRDENLRQNIYEA